MKKFLILSISFIIISCSKNETPLTSFLDCEEIKENYKEYIGELIECQFYYTLAEYEGDQYIYLNSHCADLSRNYVYNEECVDICEDDPYGQDSPCNKFLLGREDKEILLIEK